MLVSYTQREDKSISCLEKSQMMCGVRVVKHNVYSDIKSFLLFTSSAIIITVK